MAISETYREYVHDQLTAAGVRPIHIKALFGGAGVYQGETIFALMKDDRLYFRVDASNRADYEAAGASPFSPYPDKQRAMGYYELPVDVLEEPEELGKWAARAVGASQRSTAKRKPKKAT